MDVVIRNPVTGLIYTKNSYSNFKLVRSYVDTDVIKEEDNVIIEVELITPQAELNEQFNKAGQG